MVAYAPVAQLTSVASKKVSLTSKLPWVYIIAGLKDQIVYVGETHDPQGLIMRLGSHFGPFKTSTLKTRASERASVGALKPPFLVVAARLPFSEEHPAVDGTATAIRRSCEALLQQLVAERFILKSPGWVVVSETSTGGRTPSAEVETACASIFDAFTNALAYYRSLADTAPFHLVVLDPFPEAPDAEDIDVGGTLEEIETTVFSWVLDRLERHYGESWWREGVPVDIRTDCQARREHDARNEGAPPQAYMMLLDLRTIAKKNWSLCGPLMEAISGAQGKDAATAWIQELNDMRNLWAHPIRRKYAPLDPAKIVWLRDLASRCLAACRR